MPLAKPTVTQIQELAARYPSKQSAIIPALWAVQHEQGYVTDAAMSEIARHLGLPPSLIEATASFYSMFLTRPEGRHDVVICVNAPCMLRGADEMAAYLERQLGVRDGATTADGAITWHSTIECLGACGGAPMMQVDHRFEENLTPERIDAIIERLRTDPLPGSPHKGEEGELGCFRDGYVMENSRHRVLEGIMIASYAIGCNVAFIYIRGEYLPQTEALEAAIDEARQAGYLGKNVLGKGYDIDVILHRGAGAYICGEETAMLTSLEGYRGEPRLKPPFPAVKGLYGKPTVVNNVETVCNLPHIVLNGADWFKAIGTPTGSGTRLWCMSGHVNRPGNYEMENGTPIRELIEEHGGGVWKNRKLKAFQPGGASMMVLLPEHLDVGLDFDAIAKAGSLAGAGAMVVMDETTCMVDAARRYVKFFEHESCGKCTPCREGTFWMANLFDRFEAGDAKAGDIDLLLDIGYSIDGRSFCPLGDG